MKKCYQAILVLITIFLLSACNQAVKNLPETQTADTVVETITSTPAPTNTPTFFNTATRVPIPTHVPSKTATPTHEPVEVAYIGTDLPKASQPITLENIHNLMQVGQWGYGSINGAAFTPDGKQFIVSNSQGFAIYDMNDLQSPPEWITFEFPVPHDWIYFDTSGRFIKLINWGWHIDTVYTIFTFPEGKVVKDTNALVWLENVAEPDNSYMEDISSSDGTKIFRAGYSIGETQFDRHTAKCYIRDSSTDKTLFTLQDETVIISYAERHPMNGCDAGLRQACGTSNVPVSYFPYQAAFSPDNATITVRYQKWLFYDYEMTNNGFIRIYDGTDGSLLETFGNPSDQTAAFAYSPNSKYLLVTYKDGSIQLWNTHSQEIAYSGWQFNNSIESIAVSNHGENVLIERPDYLEIRSSTNGALRSRLKVLHYDLSPANDNILAYTDSDYNIKIYDINEADVLLSIPAHKDEIFDIEFSPDGKTIATSSRDCTIKLWEVETGEFLHNFEETIIDANDPFPHANLGNDRLSRIFIYRLQFIEGTNSLFGFSPWAIAVNWNTDSGATKYALYETPGDLAPFNVITKMNLIQYGDHQYNFETGEEIYRGNYSKYQESIAYFNDNLNSFKITEYQDTHFLPYYDMDNMNIGSIRILNPINTAVYLDQLFISSDESTLFISTSDGKLLVYQIVE